MVINNNFLNLEFTVKKMIKSTLCFLLTALFLVSCNKSKNVVNVFTSRHYDADKELYKKFEEKTGIKVKVNKDKDNALISKIAKEGEQSIADVLITADAGRLHLAKEKGILQPIKSDSLNELVPANLRDSDGQWYGLTVRARIFVVMKETDTASLTSYKDLADPKWKGKILIRKSDNIYNQSLVASIIANDGEEAARAWVKGIVANMARKPNGNDRGQVKALANGEGEVAVVNTYYIGKMKAAKEGGKDDDWKEQNEAFAKVKVHFPEQGEAGRGAHINVSGAGVMKHAPHKENAIKFIEFLASDEAQKVFAQANYEYPIRESIEVSELLKSWGPIKPDPLKIEELGKNNQLALKIMQEAGWD